MKPIQVFVASVVIAGLSSVAFASQTVQNSTYQYVIGTNDSVIETYVRLRSETRFPPPSI